MSENNNLVIEVTRPSAIVLPPFKGGDPDEEAGKTLIPGQNDVSEPCWKFACKNPAIQIALGAGYLKSKGNGKARPITQDYDSLTIKQASDIIEQIDDVNELNRIKVGVKKKGVRNVVLARIRALVDVAAETNKG